jgi:hypothetical protein
MICFIDGFRDWYFVYYLKNGKAIPVTDPGGP